MTEPLALAAEFPAATEAQWRALAAKVLKDKPFETLQSPTYDGFAIDPLYPRATAPRLTGRAGPWQVMQRLDAADAVAARAEAEAALAQGATGLVFVEAGASAAYGRGFTFGATIASLIGEFAPQTPIEIQPASAAIYDALAATPRASLRIGFDPVAAALRQGTALPDLNALAATLARLPEAPLAAADGRIVHDAGGSEAQELSYVIATGLALLRALEAAGLPLETARARIGFHLAADADQFMTLAKFRAFRRLWPAVEQACGLAPRPAFVSATTAWRMLLRRDPPSNILRNTVGIVAAALGGADAICALPHLAATATVDAAAHRLARNAQLVVLEEGHLDAVADPAAGSGGIEALTEQLAAAAWREFQAIERAGGIVQAVTAGTLQQAIAATRAAREAALASGKDSFVGLSDAPPAPAGLPLAAPRAQAITPLPCIRLAEALEAGETQ